MRNEEASKFLKTVICDILDGYLFTGENQPRATLKAFLAMQGFSVNDDGVVFLGNETIGVLEFTQKREAGKPDYVLKMSKYAPIITFGVALMEGYAEASDTLERKLG